MRGALLIGTVDLGVALAAQLDAVARVAGVLVRETGGQGQLSHFALLLSAECQIRVQDPIHGKITLTLFFDLPNSRCLSVLPIVRAERQLPRFVGLHVHLLLRMPQRLQYPRLLRGVEKNVRIGNAAGKRGDMRKVCKSVNCPSLYRKCSFPFLSPWT